MMNYYKTICCARCGRPLEGPFYEPCPHCRQEGHNINYETQYDLRNAEFNPDRSQPGIYQYRDFYPIAQDAPIVSIYEGNTPLVPLERLGKKLGLKKLYMKDESKNPTFSHKDRLCSLLISKAVADGAPGITISSTGNQGASAAAYASAAGLPCIIFTTPGCPSAMSTLMQALGAKLFITPTMEDRAVIMERVVRELGFVPASGIVSPPIGSSPFGVDAYKSIGFEIYEQMGNRLPDWFISPISYGDAMYGAAKGMRDLTAMGLAAMPQLCAAEAYGSIKASLAAGSEFPVYAEGHPSVQRSIATGYGAYHTLKMLRENRGIAECSSDDEALAMQLLLASTEGVYAEPASLSALVSAEKLLKQGKIDPEQTVVVLITSTGLKDPDATRAVLPEIPCINPTLEEMKAAMESCYGVSI